MMNNKIVDFFNSKAEVWDENHKGKNDLVPVIAKLSGAGEESRVLDIACGTGVMIDDLLKLNVKEIVAIDISDKMANIAKEKYLDESRVKVICTDLLEFNENGFDIAVMYNAYPHFLEKHKVIKHIHKILNENGRFIIAHGAGKDIINGCHKKINTDISTKLLSANEEAEKLKDYFNIDIIIDTPYLYVVSGTAK